MTFSNEEPVLPTPKILKRAIWQDAKWISTCKLLGWRLFLLSVISIKVLFVLIREISIIARFHTQTFHKEWINIPYQILKYSTELSTFAQTLFTCVVGLDRLYFLHIFLNGITDLINFIKLCTLVFVKFEVNNFLSILVLSFLMFTYFIWNVPTRILYVTTYREILDRHGRNFHEIIHILKLPLFFIVAIRIVLLTVRLGGLMKDSYKKWWVRGHWGYLSLECLSNVTVALYQLWMHVFLNKEKRGISYWFCCKPSCMEQSYLLLVVIISIQCITAAAFEFCKFDNKTGLYVFFEALPDILMSLWYVLLWKIALVEWNIKDLSICNLEEEMARKYHLYSNTTYEPLSVEFCKKIDKEEN